MPVPAYTNTYQNTNSITESDINNPIYINDNCNEFLKTQRLLRESFREEIERGVFKRINESVEKSYDIDKYTKMLDYQLNFGNIIDRKYYNKARTLFAEVIQYISRLNIELKDFTLTKDNSIYFSASIGKDFDLYFEVFLEEKTDQNTILMIYKSDEIVAHKPCSLAELYKDIIKIISLTNVSSSAENNESFSRAS